MGVGRKAGGRGRKVGWPECLQGASVSSHSDKKWETHRNVIGWEGKAPACITRASENEGGQRAVYKPPNATCKVSLNIFFFSIFL